MTVTINGTTGVAGVDGTAATPAIQGNDTNTGIFFPAADTIAFAEGGAEVARFDSSGNLGIGTSSPSAKLEVKTNSASDNKIISSNSSTSLQLNAFSDGTTALEVGASQPLRFIINTTERMRITAGGELFFNCTGRTNDAPNVAGGRINEVNGNEKVRVASDGLVAFQFYSPSGGTNAPVGIITANASSTSYVTSSDYRLKENIAPMTDALSKVAQLKPVTYTWKNTGASSQGFIAHELQAVVPDCVTGEKDAVDAEGNPKYQGIDTSFLVATLTAAIQELNAKVDAQALEIQALKGVA